jgi:ssDNA-binding Zn-finger/Zn-ribbon topoisomerase 1
MLTAGRKERQGKNMAKKSTNFNRWRKVGRSASDVADLMQHYGVTPDELRAYAKKNAGTTRKVVICPRCGKSIEIEIENFDGSSVCPACENDIIIPQAGAK